MSSGRTKNRQHITFMADFELVEAFERCFPGANKSAQIAIALQRYIDDVNGGKITADDVRAEAKRVQDRRLGRGVDAAPHL